LLLSRWAKSKDEWTRKSAKAAIQGTCFDWESEVGDIEPKIDADSFSRNEVIQDIISNGTTVEKRLVFGNL
jgi:hypothetical protein